MKKELNNTEAEMAFLGSMMIDRDALSEGLELLKVEDLSLPSHKIILTELSLMHTKHEPIDLLTLRSSLKVRGSLEKAGGTEYLSLIIQSVPTSANVNYYAKIVKDFSWRRQLVNIGREIIVYAEDENRSPLETALEYEGRLKQLDAASKEKDFHVIGDDLGIACSEFERIEQARRDGVSPSPISFGLKHLDKLVRIQNGNYVVIAGRPSQGKTTFALNFLLNNIEKGVLGAFISLETSESRLAFNSVVILTGIDANNARDGFLTAEEKEKIQTKRERMLALKGVWNAPAVLSIENLRVLCRRAVQKHCCKFLIVDYLQLVKSEGESDYIRVTNASNGIRDIGRELNVPIIALCQFSRKMDDRTVNSVPTPKLSDLKASGDIEQACDICVGVVRPYFYTRKEEERHDMTVDILKNREGLTGRIQLRADMSRYQISTVEQVTKGEEYDEAGNDYWYSK